jgi:NADPH:quinone reductase
MRQVRISRTGGPEVLDLADVPVPEPRPGEIRVKLAACGINFIDTYHRTGLYPLPLPSGLGLEGAGTVDAVGEGVTRFRVGDRAGFCSGPPGAYAQWHCVAATRAVRLPDAVNDEQAAAVLLKGLTAEFLVRRLRTLVAGDTVLFHAAAGGVGLIACAWLKSMGVRVIGTVGSAEKAALALEHGCAETILYRDEDVPARVRDLTDGRGCAVVFDSVGKTTLDGSLRSAARRGLVVSYGNASGPPDPVPPLVLSQRGSLFLTRPTLFDYVSTVEELDAAAAALFGVIADGTVQPVIGQRFALDDVRAAHQALESRGTFGSTILVPPGA